MKKLIEVDSKGRIIHLTKNPEFSHLLKKAYAGMENSYYYFDNIKKDD